LKEARAATGRRAAAVYFTVTRISRTATIVACVNLCVERYGHLTRFLNLKAVIGSDRHEDLANAQIYDAAYFPSRSVLGVSAPLGVAADELKGVHQRRGHEPRYFYGSYGRSAFAQTAMGMPMGERCRTGSGRRQLS